MGALAKGIKNLTSSPVNVLPTALSSGTAPRTYSAPGANVTFATAFSNNELVYSSVKLLSTSAAEPHIIGKRWRRSRGDLTAQTKLLQSMGITNRAGAMKLDAFLVANRFIEEVPEHPLVKILNNPNPKTSRGQLWSMVVMDRLLMGNAYVYKARYNLGHGVAELWRLRPDRVKIVVDPGGQVVGYDYRLGPGRSVMFLAEDVMHFKELSPLDDYYGQPPLMSVMERVNIDNYMKGFLRNYYESGGSGPGAILALKTRLSAEAKDEIRDRIKRMFGGPGGVVETMILDNTEASYTKMGLGNGLRDALPDAIEKLTSSRVAMAFGIPGSILGLVIGYESSSYANKRQDWQVLWDVTLTPLMSDLDDVLNLSLVPEFGGIDEVAFDLSDIKALQEDEDAIQERARKNFTAGLWSFEESRAVTGVDPSPKEGMFFVPAFMFPTPVEQLEERHNKLVAPDVADLEASSQEVAVNAAFFEAFPVRALNPGPGRPALAYDAEARAVWERGEGLRRDNPGMTLVQVAARLGVSERTYRRYRETFSS